MRKNVLPIAILLMGLLFGWGQTTEAQDNPLRHILDVAQNQQNCPVDQQWNEAPRIRRNQTDTDWEFDGSFPILELTGAPAFRIVDWYPYIGSQSVVYVFEPSTNVIVRTGFGAMWQATEDCDNDQIAATAIEYAVTRNNLNDVSDSGLTVWMQDENVKSILSNLQNLDEDSVVEILLNQHGFHDETAIRAAYQTWASAN